MNEQQLVERAYFEFLEGNKDSEAKYGIIYDFLEGNGLYRWAEEVREEIRLKSLACYREEDFQGDPYFQIQKQMGRRKAFKITKVLGYCKYFAVVYAFEDFRKKGLNQIIKPNDFGQQLINRFLP